MFLRSILKTMLQNAAREKVHETVAEAVRQQADKTDKPSRQVLPCQVGFVFALGIESGCLEDRLQKSVSTQGNGFVVREGMLERRAVALIQSGAGREKAALATSALIDVHQPQWVISAGFSGGLTDQMKRHHILMADQLLDQHGGHLRLDLKVDPESLATMAGVHVGRLLTADQIVCLPKAKRALGEKHQALAVDMESYAVAEICRHRKVRFMAVRVISDPVDEELPSDLQRLLDQSTTVARWGAAAGAIWNRPSSLKDMYQLKENALLASEQLARFLASTVEQLVPLPSEQKKS